MNNKKKESHSLFIRKKHVWHPNFLSQILFTLNRNNSSWCNVLKVQSRVNVPHLNECLQGILKVVCVEILKVVDEEACINVDW
jgi:hypothetical protein